MKLLLYFLALVGGGAAGALGVGSYMVYTGDPIALEAEAANAELEAEHEPSQEGADEVGGGAEATGGAQVAEGPETGALATPEGSVEAIAGGAESADATASGGGAEPAGSDAAAALASQVAATETTPVPAQQVAAPDADSLARVQQNYQRLARIFAAMGPEEAAAVLSQLDDGQLEGILLAMQGRSAAPILEEMDPVRAAALSSRILRGGEE